MHASADATYKIQISGACFFRALSGNVICHVYHSVMDQLMLVMELCVGLTLTMMDSLMWVWTATYSRIALQYV